MAAGAVALSNPISGGITAGLAGLSQIANLFGQHEARYRNAKNENDAVTAAIQVFDQDIKSVFAALNAGTISEADASQYLEKARQSYWSYVGQSQGQIRVAARPCSPGTPPNACATQHNTCDKGCTSGCCVGCTDIEPTIANAQYVIAAGGGVVHVCKVFPSPGQYGNPGRDGYTLTYTKPSTVSGITGGLSGFLGSLFGSNSPTTQLSPNLQPVQAQTTLAKGAIGISAFIIVGIFGLFVLPRLTR